MSDDDQIRRGDAKAELDRHAKGDAVIGGQHYRTLTLEVAAEAIDAIPAASSDPKPPQGWNVMQVGQTGWHVIQTAEGWKVSRVFGPEVLSQDRAELVQKLHKSDAPQAEADRPVAWMRRWAFDGDEGTHGNRPSGWKLQAVTVAHLLDDDVPLYAKPQAEAVEALVKGETFLRACQSAWAAGEPYHKVNAMLDAADEFDAALARIPGGV